MCVVFQMLNGFRRLVAHVTAGQLVQVHVPASGLVSAGRRMSQFLGDSPAFRAIQTPELDTIAGIFAKHGFELRLAGGAVRYY